MIRGVIRDDRGPVIVYRSVLLEADELGAVDLVGRPCTCTDGPWSVGGHWHTSRAWDCARDRELAHLSALEDPEPLPAPEPLEVESKPCPAERALVVCHLCPEGFCEGLEQ
jgi:hypothetical protein